MDNIREFQRSEDVMDEAYAWVLKFNGDTPASAEDIAAMREWVRRSPAHRQVLSEAEEFWCEAEILSDLAVPVEKSQRGGLGGFFSAVAGASSVSGGAASATWGRAISFASVVCLTVALMWVWQLTPISSTVGNGVYRTAVGEQSTLILSDRSQVLLDTGSAVRIAYEDGTRKIHLLDGKAHFDVAKNPERPFEVYARDGLVRAVGTAFSVYLAEEEVEVLVDEGRVDLARILAGDIAGSEVNSALPYDSSRERVGFNGAFDGSREAIPVNAVLLASQDVVGEVFLSLDVGQGARFDQAEQLLVQLSEKEMDNAQAWRKGTLVFVRDPLSDVVYEVSRYTDITIEITDPDLKNLVMGGRFKAGDLDALLEVLEIGFGVKVIYLNERHVQLSLASNE